jgi:hypothetical protein
VRNLALVAVIAALAAAAFAGCGGGGEATTSPGGAAGGAVAVTQLAEKIGLTSNGEGEYRLGGCTAKAVLASKSAVNRARASGDDVVTDPTGHYGIEIEDPDCAKVMEGAVAILNVP